MVARLPYGPGAEPSKNRHPLHRPTPPQPRYANLPLQAKKETSTPVSRPPVQISTGNLNQRRDAPPNLRQYVFDRWDQLSPEQLEAVRKVVDLEDESSSSSSRVKPVDRSSSSDTRHSQTGAPRKTARPNSTTTTLVKRKASAARGSSSEDDSDGGLWGNNPNLQIRLHIANEAEVVHFLKMRFTQIQQLATKVIAKAWIKAICPKKQANYPYVDCNPREDPTKRRRARHVGEPRIPSFWPDLDVCRHKEPDHTRKYERTNLLVHLLRLHWTEKEWLECNVGCDVPVKIQNRNWVGFLKDAFPISKLDEVQGSNPDKANSRRSYLREIYKVADDEQNFRNRMGDKNSSRTYAAGPGWVRMKSQDKLPTTQKTLREVRQESVSSSIDVQTTREAESSSDSYNVSPQTEAHGMSGAASLVSDTDYARETKVEDMVPMGLSELEEAVVPAQSWRPVQPVIPKLEANEDRVTLSINGPPSTYVGDFYAPSWNSGSSMQQSPTMYEQPLHCSSEPCQWFQGMDFSQHQQSSVPSCSSSVEPHGFWNDYRSNMGSSGSRSDAMAMQGRMASHYASVNEVQQMAMSGPFTQMVVPTADNGQYGVGGMDCSTTAGYGTHGNFMQPRQQNMYERWS